MSALPLDFPATSGFKNYELHFTKESVAHPAKANLLLLDYLIRRYTKEGDVVLDPMAGTGSTGIIASILGRNAILVELEEKFVGFINANLAKSARQGILGSRGWVRVVHGDARNLTQLLEKADAIVTSPPFGESIQFRGGTQNKERMMKGGRPAPYSTNPENIGNLRYGSIDAILSSPPYANRLSDSAVHDGDEARMSYRQSIDAVVTSPPYEAQVSNQSRKEENEYARLKEKLDKGELSGRESIRVAKKGYSPNEMQDGAYSESKENIGNLKADNYLAAMKTVYEQCHSVLKPDGLLILILKNFIRDKKVVRLDLDTQRLCESVGFSLEERLAFKLPTQSFWRILYKRKFPNVPTIDHEDILVFRRVA